MKDMIIRSSRATKSWKTQYPLMENTLFAIKLCQLIENLDFNGNTANILGNGCGQHHT